jgi:hypothetical protein
LGASDDEVVLGETLDDQIWQVRKNWTIRFHILDYLILTVLERNRTRANFEDLKIQG